MSRPLLLIASDLFFADWGSPARGGLWLSFRPHLIIGDVNHPDAFEEDFKDWIVAGHTGNDVDYKMVSEVVVPPPPARFQPVTFPSDVDIKVAIQYDGGAWSEIDIVQRSKRLSVVDPDGLYELNKPGVDGEGENKIESEPPQPPKQGKAFAYGYIESLNDALRKNAPLETLADEMMRAQTLGRTFLATDAMIAGVSTDTAIIPIVAPQKGVTAASLHSLLGHTLRLGARSDLAKLKTVTDLKITLESAGMVLKEFRFSTLVTPGQDSIASFFTALDTQFPGKVDLNWMPDLARRIYVNDGLTTFPYRAAGECFVRRREAAPGMPENDLSLADVRRLRVDVRLPDQLSARTPSTASGLSVIPPLLEFRPFVALQCRLRLYRGFPKTAGPSGFALMRLIPHAEDRADFLAELNRVIQGLDWAAQQTRLHQFFIDELDWETENDRPLSAKPQFVFWGELPWDAIDGDALPTLLFFVKPEADTDLNGNGVTLLIGRSTRLTAQQRSADPPYWETRYPIPPGGSNNKEEFHRLKLVTPVPKDEQKYLIPSIGLAGDITFHFAQSSSRVEAVAKVTYPLIHDKHEAIETVTPSEEFQDDLVSYVNLRLSGHVSSEPVEDLTGRGNLYPVYQEDFANAKCRLHTYHFSTAASAMTTDGKELDLHSIPDHFKAMYDRASSQSTAYTLSPRLAHVLGPELDGHNNISGATQVMLPDLHVARPLDFPINMATTVRTKVESGTSQEALKFLTVRFSSPATAPYTEDEVATLIFRQRFLKANNVGANTDRQTLFVEAWNAVAELCAADKILLAPYLVRYDFRSGLDREGKFRLGDSLQPVARGQFIHDIKTAVQSKLSRLYSIPNDAIPEDDLELQVVMSRSGDANRIYRLSNAVEFRLDIERPAEKIPVGEPSSWTLVRLLTTKDDGEPLPLDDTYDHEGRLVRNVDTTDPNDSRIKAGFADWLGDLKNRSDGIDANSSETAETRVFRSLLGGSAASSADTRLSPQDVVDVDDWIVPEGPVDPAPGKAQVTLMPIGFRPLQFHPLFGAKTDTMYRRYLQWIGCLINCSNIELAGANTAPDWSQYFKALYDYGQDAHGYSALMDNLAALAWPMHNPACVDPQDKPIFPTAIIDLARATATGGVVRAQLVTRIAMDFKRDPSVFFDSKAYLYSCLAGDEAANKMLPASFFRMSASRQIAKEDGPTAAVEDQVTLSVSESFSPNVEQFGFLEPLSDRRYDDEFTVAVPVLQTFEAIVDKSIGQFDKDSPTVAIPIAQCTIPNGVMGAATQPSIFLASRKRVEMPQLLAALPIKIEEVPGWINLDRTKLFGLTALKHGRLEDKDKDENNAYRWIGSSFPAPLSNRLDDPMVALIMTIEGDEETLMESLNSDSLRINLDVVMPDQPKNSNMAQKAESDFAKRLSDTIDFNRAKDDFDLAISPDIFVQMSKSAMPATIPSLQESEKWLTLNFKTASAGNTIEIDIVPNEWPHKDGGVTVHLLRNDTDAAARTLVLIVLAELPVWRSYQVEALQTRNSMTAGSAAPGRIFAPEFGMSSEQLSNTDPLSIEAVVDVYQNESIELAASSLTVEQLVSELLLAEHDFTNDNGLNGRRAILTNDSEWRSHDLSITISHEQRVETPQAYFRSDGSEASSVDVALPTNRPLFPFRNVNIDKDGPVNQLRDWWVPGVVDYQVEFHWSSTTNLRFFSIKGVRCRIEP
ncbi:hypothetical protein [Pseudomonas fluorescens]|uniref:Uncharacterized protein n=2 Tax=Pseudomonas TaxID=286 RepID=A0A0W0I210_PSEFL|nr:hypothetical protein [Pseudomonas fluorescens]KTB67079.1 hypothetical protein AO063_21515 [Pseudomonas fluorescens ICMP 11288]